MEERKSFRTKLRNTYKMPFHEKIPLIEKNIKYLFIIIPILLTFGLIYTAIVLIKYKGNLAENFSEFLYYIAIDLISSLNFIILFLCKKHKEWNTIQRNLSLYICFGLMMGLSTYTFYFSHNQLNSFILFAIISVVGIIFFYIEPIVYIAILACFSGLFIYRCYITISFATAFDVFLYSFALCVFSLYKWRSLIAEQKQKKKIEEHSNSLEKELKLAAHVQQSFYKTGIDEIKGYEIQVFSKAMTGVSGDLYDFYKVDEKINGIGLFDVSGHGLSSGLVTMLVRNIIHREFYRNKEKSLADIVQIIDDKFKKEKGGIENYLTGIILRINENNLEMVNAGHQNPIFYKKSEKKFFFLDQEKRYRSTVIGLDLIESFYNSMPFTMESGDEILLYTDGITESLNKDYQQYGKFRLLESFKTMIESDLQSQLNYVLQSYRGYIAGMKSTDDVTVIILRKL